jgi:diacylglycerol kinase family enzyme
VGSPFGALAVIADPEAGGGRVRDELDAVRRSLNERGLDHDLWVTERPGDGERLASEALAAGHRFVVAVGADGIVQDVVNGLLSDGAGQEPVLGVVSAGSACDLMKSFGLPDDTAGGCAHLTGDNTYPLDVMRVTCRGPDGDTHSRYAHNIAEVGLGAAVSARTAAGRGRFGAFWRTYLGYRVPTMRVGIDAKEDRAFRAWNLVIGNGQFSAGLRLSPRSFPGDGVLEALVFTGPKSDAYRMLPRIYRHGDHVPDPGITELRVRIRVGVEASKHLRVVADGRPLGTTPVTFQLVPRRILLKL